MLKTTQFRFASLTCTIFKEQQKNSKFLKGVPSISIKFIKFNDVIRTRLELKKSRNMYYLTEKTTNNLKFIELFLF